MSIRSIRSIPLTPTRSTPRNKSARLDVKSRGRSLGGLPLLSLILDYE